MICRKQNFGPNAQYVPLIYKFHCRRLILWNCTCRQVVLVDSSAVVAENVHFYWTCMLHNDPNYSPVHKHYSKDTSQSLSPLLCDWQTPWNESLQYVFWSKVLVKNLERPAMTFFLCRSVVHGTGSHSTEHAQKSQQYMPDTNALSNFVLERIGRHLGWYYTVLLPVSQGIRTFVPFVSRVYHWMYNWLDWLNWLDQSLQSHVDSYMADHMKTYCQRSVTSKLSTSSVMFFGGFSAAEKCFQKTFQHKPWSCTAFFVIYIWQSVVHEASRLDSTRSVPGPALLRHGSARAAELVGFTLVYVFTFTGSTALRISNFWSGCACTNESLCDRSVPLEVVKVWPLG